MGFRRTEDPEAFRNACHKFVFTEVLRKPADISSGTNKAEAEVPRPQQPDTPCTHRRTQAACLPREFLMEALDKSSDDNGWPIWAPSAATCKRSSPTSTPGLWVQTALRPRPRAHRPIRHRRAQRTGKHRQQLYIKAKPQGATETST